MVSDDSTDANENKTLNHMCVDMSDNVESIVCAHHTVAARWRRRGGHCGSPSDRHCGSIKWQQSAPCTNGLSSNQRPATEGDQQTMAANATAVRSLHERPQQQLGTSTCGPLCCMQKRCRTVHCQCSTRRASTDRQLWQTHTAHREKQISV